MIGLMEKQSCYRRYSTTLIVLILNTLYSILCTQYLNRTRLLHSLRSFAMTRIMDVARLSGRLRIKNRQYVDSLIVILNCRHCEERSDEVYLPFGRQS